MTKFLNHSTTICSQQGSWGFSNAEKRINVNWAKINPEKESSNSPSNNDGNININKNQLIHIHLNK